MNDSQTILQTFGLKKYFKVHNGFLHAVDDVSIRLSRGRTLGVVGESGCGKSTLGRLLLRLIEPSGGDIHLQGQSILNLKREELRNVRKRMQIVFQDPYSSINPRMTVQQIIAENMIVNKMYSKRSEVRRQTMKLMDMVGLSAKTTFLYPHELDGGRRQRIGIARALSVNPEIVVCDEPVSALDVSIQAQILNLMMDLQDEYHLTYLFITHDLSVVKHISDEVMVMYMGKVVERATSEELFTNPLHPYTRALLSAIPSLNAYRKGTQSIVLKGEVTSPVNPVASCRFAPRCEDALDRCLHHDPEEAIDQNGHMVACFNVRRQSARQAMKGEQQLR